MSCVLVFLCLVAAGSAMSVKSSKRFTYTSPDGSDNMFMERSAQADLDSSASGYIYQSNGDGPPMMVELGPYPAAQAFNQINQAYESLIQPVSEEFVKGGGSEGSGAYFQNHGEKGEKGYSGFDEFQKGLLNKYNKKQDSGFYNSAAGQKKGHHDVGGYYGSQQAAQKGVNGGSVGHENSHKKGHKTTGYHNVYHKDEYKKEHSFYDEADDAGHKNHYAKGEAAYGANNGGFQHGGHQDAAFQEGAAGRKGSYDKGTSAEEAAGYKGGKGDDSHYATGSEFSKQGSNNFQKRFGFGHSGFGY